MVDVDSDFEEFVKQLSPECDRLQEELVQMFEFTDRMHAQAAVAVPADEALEKKVKTRKPRVKREMQDTVIVLKDKPKFSSIQEEAEFRLYSKFSKKKTSLIENLVRACFNEFGYTWVTWKQVKEIAARVGYKPSSQLFKSVWVLTHCLHNTKMRKCAWIPALTFPYWDLDTTQFDQMVALYGKTAVKDELYMLRLSVHFFTLPQQHIVSV